MFDKSISKGASSMKRVVIIGAGIGGIATANLLAKKGYNVTVVEQHAAPGGRAGKLEKDGFTFDTGPSWYLMPDVFERYLRQFDTSADAEFKLQKLNPSYRVYFENAKSLVITSDLATDAKSFESIEPGAGQKLVKYVAKSERIYRTSLETFLYSNFTKLRDILNPSALRNGPEVLLLAGQTLHSYVARKFHDQRLRQILEYHMVFLGTSAFRAPALYSLMSALDFTEGVFYPRGGIYKIIERLVAIGEKLGVRYQYDTPVEYINVESGKATGITCRDGSIIPADIIISNADLHFTETSLVPKPYQTYPEKYWQKKQASPSALLMYLGVRGDLSALSHHSLFFVDAWKENFDRMEQDTFAPDAMASMYVCRASATDPNCAPKGHENIFVLVPLPKSAGSSQTEYEKLANLYIAQIEEMSGVSFKKDIVSKTLFGPGDFKSELNAWNSSMLGQSHLLRQSAFFRTRNRSKKVHNLFYAGANTVPGIGLPMCLIGAELVAKRVDEMDKNERDV
jgi:1-hydroxy-2-isopentenylcarotenoid 3,4-desaturase